MTTTDNTTLSAGTGGDTIRTEVVGYDVSGNVIKVQLIKVLKGRGRISLPGSESSPGADDGAVGDNNPFPVVDHKCRRILEEIYVIEAETLEVLQEIRDSLRSRHVGGKRPIIGRP